MPKRYWNPKRRRFLETAVTAAAAASATSCTRSSGSWRRLSSEEAAIAAAICDCIVPPDEWPGAAEAGAVVFLDRQLAGHLRKHLADYQKGLKGIDALARQKHGRGFAELAAAEQAAILKEVEKSKDAGLRSFFGLIRNHTMMSYYGDPRHGGNRDEVGYRMIGLPLTPVRGREKHDLTGGKS